VRRDFSTEAQTTSERARKGENNRSLHSAGYQDHANISLPPYNAWNASVTFKGFIPKAAVIYQRISLRHKPPLKRFFERKIELEVKHKHFQAP
jgi:hypothetical protein